MKENAGSYFGDLYNQDPMTHRDISEELTFFHHVYQGDMDAIQTNCREHRFMDNNGVGQLSSDPILNLKYHMVVTTAIITRGCIQHGLEAERSFQMSDYYIRKLDTAKTASQVEQIHNNMVLDFTGKMRLIRRDHGLSRPIRKCIDLIYAGIQDRITVEELAQKTNVSTSYLSRQFSRELGIPISDYIREKKIERAEELLKRTDYSVLDISCMLGFSSQSHFIQVFKSIVGMTPKKYRSLHSSEDWN